MAEHCTGRGGAAWSPSAPLAAAVGAEAIRSGGNALDGAVAAALAETVLLPPKCGLGGDLIAPVCEQEPEPVALIAIGGAPAGLEAVAAAGQLHETGPSSVGPPGGAGRLPGAGRARHAATRPPGGAGDRATATASHGRRSPRHSRTRLRAPARPEPGRHRVPPRRSADQPGRARHAAGPGARLGGGFVAGGGAARCAGCGADRRCGGAAARSRPTTSNPFVRSGCRQRGEAASVPVWATPAPTHGASLLDAVAGFSGEAAPAAVWDAVSAIAASASRSAIPPSLPARPRSVPQMPTATPSWSSTPTPTRDSGAGSLSTVSTSC